MFLGLKGLMNKITSLRVTRETRNRLAEVGTKDETFDEIIQRLIEFYEKNNQASIGRTMARKAVGGTR